MSMVTDEAATKLSVDKDAVDVLMKVVDKEDIGNHRAMASSGSNLNNFSNLHFRSHNGAHFLGQTQQRKKQDDDMSSMTMGFGSSTTGMFYNFRTNTKTGSDSPFQTAQTATADQMAAMPSLSLPPQPSPAPRPVPSAEVRAKMDAAAAALIAQQQAQARQSPAGYRPIPSAEVIAKMDAAAKKVIAQQQAQQAAQQQAQQLSRDPQLDLSSATLQQIAELRRREYEVALERARKTFSPADIKAILNGTHPHVQHLQHLVRYINN